MRTRPISKLAIAVTLSTGLLLAGCGGSDDASAEGGSSTSAPGSASGGSTSESASSSSAAEETASGESELVPVPTADDGSPGLATVTEFPVPAGAEVESLGSPFNGSWQFTVSGVDAEELAAFYLQALPALGYTATEDAVIVVGVNEVEFAAGWSGPAYGTVDAFGMVSVNDRPADGLTLDGVLVG